MADAPHHGPMLVRSDEELAIGGGVRMRRAIGVALQGERRDRDPGTLGKSPLVLIELGGSRSQPEPPPVVMDDDLDVVGIVERAHRPRRTWRRRMPTAETRCSQISRAKSGHSHRSLLDSPFGREVELVPPREFCRRWQGLDIGRGRGRSDTR